MGLESPVTLHVDNPPMLPMFMFIEAEAEEPISLETATTKYHALTRFRYLPTGKQENNFRTNKKAQIFVLRYRGSENYW